MQLGELADDLADLVGRAGFSATSTAWHPAGTFGWKSDMRGAVSGGWHCRTAAVSREGQEHVSQAHTDVDVVRGSIEHRVRELGPSLAAVGAKGMIAVIGAAAL